MPRKIKVAAVRMEGAPAPKAERLQRADALIAETASAGAQLVVLPELFNTGYEYHDNNYALPEPIDGETVTWLKERAAQYNVHLAGSLLIMDGKDVYNSQIIVAPDGRLWRYDKNYPWLFERAYFRDGHDITVADTDLGKLGMMVCWDYAHPELWARYAGKIDALVITSSPPRMARFVMIMPDGSRVDSRALGPVVSKAYYGKDEPFGTDLDAHVGWLGVPAINTTAGGEFRSHFPRPRLALFFYTIMRPDLWRHVRKAHDAELLTDYYHQTKIIDSTGAVIQRVDENTREGFVLSEVELAEATPAASEEKQPDFSYAASTYFFTDLFGPAQMENRYRQGVRQNWGQATAPNKGSYRWHVISILAVLGVIATLLRFLGRLTSGRGDVQES